MRSTVRFPTHLLICFYEYVPVHTSTYLVHTEYTGTYWYALVNVLEFQVQTSTYTVGTVPYWCELFCIGAYYAIVSYHLVLLCSCTYHLVMQLTILRISTFRFGTRYIQICIVISAVQIWMYLVPN